MSEKRVKAIKAYIRCRHDVYVKPYSTTIECKEVVIRDKEEELELMSELLYKYKTFIFLKNKHIKFNKHILLATCYLLLAVP